MKILRTVAAAMIAAPIAATAQPVTPADLIVVNARVHTVDDSRPIVSGFAIRDGRFVFAGSDVEVRALAGSGTRVVDAKGAAIIPGMVDAHAHLIGLGQSLSNVALAGLKIYDEVIARVVERARTAKPGEWIQGRGWDQNLWPSKEFPTHEALSRPLPNNPVVLTRIDGHAILANAMAMRTAGVTAATRDPSGGRIMRLRDNSPSGVLVDNAEGLIFRSVPAATAEQKREAILAAVSEANKWGLIGIHDAGQPRSVIAYTNRLAREGAQPPELRADRGIQRRIMHYSEGAKRRSDWARMDR